MTRGIEHAGAERPPRFAGRRDPAPTDPGRLPAGRAATWPPPASRALRYSLRSVPRVPAGPPAAALDPAVVQAARRDPVARGGRGPEPDQQAAPNTRKEDAMRGCRCLIVALVVLFLGLYIAGSLLTAALH